jgi:hypothetical protein
MEFIFLFVGHHGAMEKIQLNCSQAVVTLRAAQL